MAATDILSYAFTWNESYHYFLMFSTLLDESNDHMLEKIHCKYAVLRYTSALEIYFAQLLNTLSYIC